MQKFRLYNEELNHTKRHKHAVLGYVLEGKLPHYLAGAPVHPGELDDLRVMRECTSRFFIALALAKRSPYTASFNAGVVRLIESGIVQHWKESITYESVNSTVSDLFEKDGRKNTGPEVLRLEHVKGAFLLLAAGFVICVIVFIAELSINRILFKDNHNQVIYVSNDYTIFCFLSLSLSSSSSPPKSTPPPTYLSILHYHLFLLFVYCNIREILISTGMEQSSSYKLYYFRGHLLFC
jgi:hypothetical protein